jgi:thymidine phosphorylase
MSKKIAEGTSALVLDVKFGAGAFMVDFARSLELAETMVGIGERNGVHTRALLTDMDAPLGAACGNGLEVTESVEVLAGGGPEDVVEVTLALAREMLDAVGIDADPADALKDGRAMDRWRAMVRAQGGDPDAAIPRARVVHEVRAERAGILQRLDARAVGDAVWRLGAGRARKEDPVSPSAGAVVRLKPGAPVAAGQVLLELHADDEARIPDALAALGTGIVIGDEAPAPRPLVARRVTG